MKIIKFLIPILKKIDKPWKKIIGRSRIFSLRFQADWQCGHLIIGNNVMINQRVIFQGKGRLQLEDGVNLGYEIGGAPTLPILLQPREIDLIIQIGKGSSLVNGTEIIARIKIGDNCRIGAKCIILDADFHGIKPAERSQGGKIAPVFIGNNVWLGINVTILKGVTIGNDAVVGAGFVVTRDVPAGGIVAGNPMKLIGSVYDD